MSTATKPVKNKIVVVTKVKVKRYREKRLTPQEYRLKSIYLKEWHARIDDNTWWESSLGQL